MRTLHERNVSLSLDRDTANDMVFGQRDHGRDSSLPQVIVMRAIGICWKERDNMALTRGAKPLELGQLWFYGIQPSHQSG